MRACVIPEGSEHDPNAFAGRIRLFDPLDAVAGSYPLQWRVGSPATDDPLDDDVIILQRTPFASVAAIDHAAERLSSARRRGARVLWEIDDAIFCETLPELIASSAVDEIDEDAVAIVQAHRTLLPIVSAFVCSTAPLADELRRLAPRTPIHVIPNALNFAHPRWITTRNRRECFTIGWSGGSRVGRDLELIVPVISAAIEEFAPRMKFLLAGATKYARLFDGLPPDRVEFVDWVPYDDYPALLARYDIALVPMEDHIYNRCKSALKVIDYAAVGAPSICSPTQPFIDSFDEVAAFARDTDEWMDAIEALLIMSTRERCALQAHARMRHGVAGIVDPWWRALSGHDD